MTDTQPRTPAGSPAGGQFGNKPGGAESDMTLAAPDTKLGSHEMTMARNYERRGRLRRATLEALAEWNAEQSLMENVAGVRAVCPDATEVIPDYTSPAREISRITCPHVKMADDVTFARAHGLSVGDLLFPTNLNGSGQPVDVQAMPVPPEASTVLWHDELEAMGPDKMFGFAAAGAAMAAELAVTPEWNGGDVCASIDERLANRARVHVGGTGPSDPYFRRLADAFKVEYESADGCGGCGDCADCGDGESWAGA